MRLGLVCLLLVPAAGCAARFRAELVTATAVPVARAAPERPGEPVQGVAPGVELPITDPAAPHRIRYTVALPSAMELHYSVTCPGSTQTGTIGETFAVYKQRRLAELERQRQSNANLVGGVVGAVAPPVKAGVEGGAKAPGGEAEGGASVEVDPGAAAAGAAYAAQGDPELPIGDTGSRIVTGKIEINASEPGLCAVALWSELPEQDVTGVIMDVQFEKLIDVRAEKNRLRAEANARYEENGKQVRVTLYGSLVARGADPGKWERDQEAERARRAEAQRVRDEERRKRDQERAARDEERRRKRDEANWAREEKRRKKWEAEWAISQKGLELRLRIRRACVGLGADPDKWRLDQERARAEREEQQRRRAEAQAARDQEQRRRDEQDLLAWEAEQKRRASLQAEADAELRREYEYGLAVRGQMKLRLVASGAVDRPPRPAPMAESPPAAPYVDAVWVTGEYAWNGAAWVWLDGHYERAPAPDTVYVAPVQVEVRGTIVVKPGGWIKVKGKKAPRVEVRDHR